MALYHVIDIEKQEVVNITEWDGVTQWSPGEGFVAEQLSPYVGIGFVKINGEWVCPQSNTE